jgi:hypothetical protein
MISGSVILNLEHGRVQQKLMRHSDIRTTMNIYGDAMSEEMRQAHGKIVQMALAPRVNGTENGTGDS